MYEQVSSRSPTRLRTEKNNLGSTFSLDIPHRSNTATTVRNSHRRSTSSSISPSASTEKRRRGSSRRLNPGVLWIRE